MLARFWLMALTVRCLVSACAEGGHGAAAGRCTGELCRPDGSANTGGSPVSTEGGVTIPGGDASEGADTSAAGNNGTGGAGSSGGALSNCPTGLPGPPLVRVPAPTPYCMDATEVTNDQYATFLGAASTTGQGGTCAWNTTFTPKTWPPTAGRGDHPVAGVDWCDAAAFCTWAGKRLCGKVGGGASPYDAFTDPAVSQWFHACSADGSRAYPYGSTFDPARCIGVDNPSAGAVPATMPVGTVTCQGGYDGLFDLSGNVSEWENSCNGTTGANDLCRFRGGAADRADVHLACANGGYETRHAQHSVVGLRCCLD